MVTWSLAWWGLQGLRAGCELEKCKSKYPFRLQLKGQHRAPLYRKHSTPIPHGRALPRATGQGASGFSDTYKWVQPMQGRPTPPRTPPAK